MVGGSKRKYKNLGRNTNAQNKSLKDEVSAVTSNKKQCRLKSVVDTDYNKHNALLPHFLVKSKIRYQDTLPEYVTKENVFCVTYSVFIFIFAQL